MQLVRWDRTFEVARTERSVDPTEHIYEVPLIVGKSMYESESDNYRFIIGSPQKFIKY